MSAAARRVHPVGRDVGHWSRLASVARERASEHSDEAMKAPDREAAALHLEQHAHLLGLAEAYERRSRDGADR